MSIEIDGDDDDTLAISLSDIKPSVVTRLLGDMFARSKRRKQLASKRTGTDEDAKDNEPDEALEEMQKNSSLHSEKRGSPAPVKANEEDFASGDLRRALKTMPAGTLRKRK